MPMAAAWLAPVTLGWLLSPFVVRCTASEAAGRRAAERRVFVTDQGIRDLQPRIGSVAEPNMR